MDLQPILETIINGVLVVVIPVVTTAAIAFVREKVKGSQIEEAIDIVLDAVDETNQTFADQLRADGKFDEYHQKEALEKSLKKSLSMMNERMLKFLDKEFNDAEAWIVSKIESACKINKAERSA
ncbi:hypothetical protein [Anaerocolumna xylanovorans]|uniref:Bacteriophage holin of superfamily 6 (Holin_LLH) n=1 Tax=Anaerocolumna xylanovorans DSM 12503 TaxID=1121345 RepID=A0A1M7YBN4_9FIRM|nr:hypothetical protein [Anaerocolumna xylanovorans]SHO50050.1 hypothetical protein SAMN02745217_02550 [Anaerocolumna xylanovorans DSM 12503]